MILLPFVDEEGRALPLLRSSAIPTRFRHGFTTRAGGVSVAPYDSFNLGGKWGDAPESVAENRRRLARAAGAPLFVATQVHGAAIARVRAGDTPADLAGAFAAVHAGWRGTVAGVLPAAVSALGEHFGARAGDLRVALGPAIGPCCFEVGPEVVGEFEARLPGARAAGVIVDAGGKARIDLKLANRLLLERAGVAPEAIDAGEECTSSDRSRFYSFRRDRGETGQHLGFIARG